LAKGKTLADALCLKEEHIIKALGGLPEAKEHCSNLGVATLQSAIRDYLAKHGRSIEEFL
jgi:nitrogen fixation protein NifU and related proteins